MSFAKRKAEKERAALKKRYWTFVAYPDSLPPDWVSRLEDKGCKGFISPLHDRDFEEDGVTPLKPHYHVVLCYRGPTTYNLVNTLSRDIGQTRPEPVEDIQGMYEYLNHSNRPHKAQYSAEDIRSIGGARKEDYINLTKAEERRIKDSILDFVIERGVCEYLDLLVLLRADEMLDEYDWAWGHTLACNSLVKSMKYKEQEARNGNESKGGRKRES